MSWVSNSDSPSVTTTKVGPGAYNLLFDPVDDDLYVLRYDYTNTTQGWITILSATTHAVLKVLGVDGGAEVPAIKEDNETGVVFAEGDFLNSSCGCYGPTRVEAIAPTTFSILWNTTVPLGAYALLADQFDGKVYAIGGGPNGSVTVIDSGSGAIVGTISGPTGATFGCVDSQTGDVYVADEGSGTVEVISGASNQLLALIPVPGNAISAIVADPVTGNVFVATEEVDQYDTPQYFNGTEVMISGSSLRVASVRDLGDDVQSTLAVGPPGTILSLGGSTNISVVDSSDNVPIEEFAAAPGAYYMTYEPTTGRIYTTTWYPSVLTVYWSIPALSPERPAWTGLAGFLSASGFLLSALSGMVAAGAFGWTLGSSEGRRPGRPPRTSE